MFKINNINGLSGNFRFKKMITNKANIVTFNDV